jgi:threonine synthase
MQSLQQSGRFEIGPEPLARIRSEFEATALSESEIAAEIRQTWTESGYLADPHTAIGIGAARQKLARDAATPTIVLGTAHPAKFPAAVKAASGVEPVLPAHLADLMERKERVTLLPNDLAAIETFVREHARAVRGAAA